MAKFNLAARQKVISYLTKNLGLSPELAKKVFDYYRASVKGWETLEFEMVPNISYMFPFEDTEEGFRFWYDIKETSDEFVSRNIKGSLIMNQYSKSLLTISHHPDIGWSWMELQSISLDLWDALGTFDPDREYPGQISDEKCTFLCFIIAMSDQDLHECFGIPLPASPIKKA